MGQLLTTLNPWQPLSKPIMEQHKDFLTDKAKSISSVMDFEMCCVEMVIDGKFNAGRLEVWYFFVHAVWRHIPNAKRKAINSVVKRWFILFLSELPQQKDRIQEMQLEWKSMVE